MSIAELISALFTSAGPGGIIVLFVMGLAGLVYFWLTRWIITGGKVEPTDYDRIR